jgi:exonuclease SbcD
VLAAHLTVTGAHSGGGEREAQTIFDYHVAPGVFPSALHYVALGHLHRTQSVPAGPPAWYSGSPIQVDFGEERTEQHVLVVDAEPGRPARVERRTLGTPDRLRTVRGSLAELAALAPEVGDAWLRVFVREPARSDLADDVRALLGDRVVDVRVELEPDAPRGRALPTRRGRAPHDLFSEYLAQQRVDDERLVALFDRLLDDEVGERSA